MRTPWFLATSILLVASTFSMAQPAADVVVADGDVTITADEFAAILRGAPEKIQKRAASDLGDRFELINALIVSRKIAQQADELRPGDPGYWELQHKLLGVKEQFAFERLMAEMSPPRVEPLAREYYETQKEKYARIPEYRESSHILLASPPGLDREPVRAQAQELLEKLQDGADFEELVQEYSGDPGSRRRDGALGRPVYFGDPTVVPSYSEALFAIDEVGEYSPPTDSQFGVHIIRLDGITPSRYKTFEEARPRIEADILKEARSLAAKEIRGRYEMGDESFIDGDAMEEIFAPYK